MTTSPIIPISTAGQRSTLKAILSARPTPTQRTPSWGTVLHNFVPLPKEALLLGVAFDGLPLLLNLHDHIPGPVLIAADAGAGKTALLQNIARTLIETHQTQDVQYGVITPHPDEWEVVAETPHRVGIFPTHHESAEDLILSLAAWAHGNKNVNQSIVLLIDDIEEVSKLEGDTLQNLRWLLLRGPARRVWLIVTMNAERYGRVLAWIPNFTTRIFGRIGNDTIANALSGEQVAGISELETPSQFCVREGDQWLRFWVPAFDG